MAKKQKGIFDSLFGGKKFTPFEKALGGAVAYAILSEKKERNKYAWRDKYICEDLNPDYFETEYDYLEAIEEEKYKWRDERFGDYLEYDVDPEDYETEEEFDEALEEAKYGWREAYSDSYEEYGIDPDNYETEDEYLEEIEKLING